jgi:uncharacterized 2Fe-2S/4Fe-4S cluster protein (DUF4445 family)
MNHDQPDMKKNTNELTISFLPFNISLKVKPGTTLLEAVRGAQVPLKTTCGGKGTCGDCIVKILRGAYKKKSSAALPDQLASQGYVLACQTEITESLTIELPEFEELAVKDFPAFRFIEENKDNLSGVYEIDAMVKSIELLLPSPTLEDNSSDLKRIKRELHKKLVPKNLECAYSVLKKLASSVRDSRGRIKLVLFEQGENRTIIDVWPAQKKKMVRGIACDIGTSTVVLHLVDLENGQILATASSYNRQIKCGEDVISRINYAQKPGRLEELQKLVALTVNNLIQKAARSAHAALSDIYFGSFSGNTTMTHLFLNLEPRFIREEPYVPTLNDVPIGLSRDLGLKMNKEARIFCAPLVGSYVGGDITAGMLSTPMLRTSERISLFIDIGTNGELVVGNKEWLITCACSAGPAFEGGGIKGGMPASQGAIEQVRIKEDGTIDYKVIGDGKPRGLCGSGLVDLLAELFVHGQIDRCGKFKEEKAPGRLLETEQGLGFLVEKGDQSFWGKALVVTERDISTLIRTKGAVFSAISLLLKNVGLSYDQIDELYIAGGFGQNLDIENAVRIGLLPDLPRDKYHYLGNSSLIGAYLILLSRKNMDLVARIAEKMTYIELNAEPGYMNEYTGSLFLPHTDIDLFPSVKQVFHKK